MAKQFELSKARLRDLTGIFSGNNLSNQELAKLNPGEEIKSIRRAEKLFAELEDQSAEYNDFLEKNLVKPMAKKRDELISNMKEVEDKKYANEQEKDAAMKAYVKFSNEELKKLEEDIDKEFNIKALGEEKVWVKVESDERFDFMKKVFEKVCCDRYTQRKALVETYDAIEAAKEL